MAPTPTYGSRPTGPMKDTTMDEARVRAIVERWVMPTERGSYMIVDEDLPRRAADIERRMKAAFAEMAKEFELIEDIRGRGVLLGVELVTDRERKTPANEETAAITRHCLDAGLIFQVRGGGPGKANIMRFVPPMTASDAEIDRALSILHDAFALVSARLPSH